MAKSLQQSLAYVRAEDAPKLSPPANLVGWRGWVLANLFPNWQNGLLTIVASLFLYWVLSNVLGWALFRAVWTGENRDVCAVQGVGACWPFVGAKFAQWIYGFYPIDQRWRVNICFIVGLCALIPLLMPSVPCKKWNALFFLMVFPLMSFILLTGGNFSISLSSFLSVAVIFAVIASFLPLVVLGMEEGLHHSRRGLVLAGIGFILWLSDFFIVFKSMSTPLGELPYSTVGGFLLVFAGGAMGLAQIGRLQTLDARSTARSWLVVFLSVLAVMLLLRTDYGLTYVETPQWGGLLVTLVVAITGIVFSLPLGILLALGRRSDMPVVKYFSIGFIEIWRGVPLITVLFMAMYMLPLFLPPGTNLDKLSRALVGIALFSSAYMAEVVRGGLQAIPKGQIEAAHALGLPYWQTMRLIVLPQALKIVIPGIVNTFIGLFKDTTLLTVVGLFDLLGIVITGFADAKWASPQTPPTGYFTAALIFWIFCFGMSRYSQFIERRLNTGHKR